MNHNKEKNTNEISLIALKNMLILAELISPYVLKLKSNDYAKQVYVFMLKNIRLYKKELINQNNNINIIKYYIHTFMILYIHLLEYCLIIPYKIKNTNLNRTTNTKLQNDIKFYKKLMISYLSSTVNEILILNDFLMNSITYIEHLNNFQILNKYIKNNLNLSYNLFAFLLQQYHKLLLKDFYLIIYNISEFNPLYDYISKYTFKQLSFYMKECWNINK